MLSTLNSDLTLGKKTHTSFVSRRIFINYFKFLEPSLIFFSILQKEFIYFILYYHFYKKPLYVYLF